jgi:hypothetical protein
MVAGVRPLRMVHAGLDEPSIEFYKSLGAQPMDQWMVFRMDGKSLEDLGK